MGMAMEITLEYNQPKPITLTFQLRVRETDRSAFRKSTGLAEPTLGTATITLKPGDMPNEYHALLSEGVRHQPELIVPYPCSDEDIRTSLREALDADLVGKQLFGDLQKALEDYRNHFEQEHAAQLDELTRRIEQAEQRGDPEQSVPALERLGESLQALQNEFNAGQRIVIERFRSALEQCPTIQLRTANESDLLYDLIYRARVGHEHQRLGLSEGTGSYGPARLNRVLENHDQVLRNLREEWTTLRNEAARRERTRAVDEWIAQHGSERLRLARENGYPVERLYYQDRVAKTLEALEHRYHIDFDRVWEATLKSSPSLEALQLEKRLRQIAPEASCLVVLAAPIHLLGGEQHEDIREREVVCLSGLFEGCPDIYVEP